MAILALPLLFASCSNDEVIAEETVEVSFSAALPQKVQSRASGELNVNKVVCATFENGTEIAALRQTVDIAAGQDIVYSPRLVKGRKYQVAFWAMKDSAYNVSDMTTITTKDGNYTGNPELYECFTNSTDEFTVTGNNNATIKLTRPMARINLGVSYADMQAVKTLGYIPTKVEIKIEAAKSYNALGKSCGSIQSQTMTLPVTDGTLSVNGNSYNVIASYMVFTDGSNVSLEYTIYGKKGENGSEESLVSHSIANVPLSVNKNTNIAGDLMTGTISYTISMGSAYCEDDNQTI